MINDCMTGLYAALALILLIALVHGLRQLPDNRHQPQETTATVTVQGRVLASVS